MNRALADFVKEQNPDFYWSVLFAPADKRDALLSLYAFALEVKRIPTLVSEPALGEIRMQWWIDGLIGERSAELLSHPVGEALINTSTSYSLPLQPLIDLIDARVVLLHTDPQSPPDEAALELFCGRCHAAMIHFASIILNDGRIPSTSDAAGHAGMVLGLIEILREELFTISKTDIVNLAQEHLIKLRSLLSDVPKPLLAAYLPLVIAEPFLERFEKGFNRQQAEPDSWRILWRMMRVSI
ncbi:MAG: squalene/phytoene synthase family protein [Hyphomicrobiales bacterium]